MGLEPGAAGWKAPTNPLSYGGTPIETSIIMRICPKNQTHWVVQHHKIFITNKKHKYIQCRVGWHLNLFGFCPKS